MTPLAGSVALNLALGFSIISIVSLSIYTSNNDERINLLGHRSALASSFLVFLSTFVLSYQLMISNFDIDYVARYTSFGIKHLLEKSGFEIKKITKTSSYFLAIGQLFIAYLGQHVLPKGRFTGLLAQFIIIFPLNIFFLLANLILPKSDEFYSNIVIFGQKLEK